MPGPALFDPDFGDGGIEIAHIFRLFDGVAGGLIQTFGPQSRRRASCRAGNRRPAPQRDPLPRRPRAPTAPRSPRESRSSPAVGARPRGDEHGALPATRPHRPDACRRRAESPARASLEDDTVASCPRRSPAQSSGSTTAPFVIPSSSRRREQPRLPGVLRPARGARDERGLLDERVARLHEHALQAPGRLQAEGRRRRLGHACSPPGRDLRGLQVGAAADAGSPARAISTLPPDRRGLRLPESSSRAGRRTT